jgi:hypothetical protein
MLQARLNERLFWKDTGKDAMARLMRALREIGIGTHRRDELPQK